MLPQISTEIPADAPRRQGGARRRETLIKALPLKGAVVTGDAAFTFKPVVDAIRERGGDYFLFVKANQPELRAELARAFGDVSPSGHRQRGAAQNKRAA